MTTQERFMSAMRTIALNCGIDLIDDQTFANTGTLRFVPRGSWEPIVEFYYSFQSGYASFLRVQNGQNGPDGLAPGAGYVRFEGLPSVIDLVRRRVSDALFVDGWDLRDPHGVAS